MIRIYECINMTAFSSHRKSAKIFTFIIFVFYLFYAGSLQFNSLIKMTLKISVTYSYGNYAVHCISMHITIKLRHMITPSCSSPLMPHLEYCDQFWTPQ